GSDTVSVLLGKGDGTLGPMSDYGTGSNPYSVALGDLNGDGKLELAVANDGIYLAFVGSVLVLLGDEDAPLGPKNYYGTRNTSVSVVFGDHSDDGQLHPLPTRRSSDLGSGTVSVLLGKGDGTLGPKSDYGTGRNPDSVAIGDLNGDG